MSSPLGPTPESRERLARSGEPAIARLKAEGANQPLSPTILAPLLRTTLNDKLFSQSAWEKLDSFGIIGSIFANLALRTNNPEVAAAYNAAMQILPDIATQSYGGSPEENDGIGRAIAQSVGPKRDLARQLTREHAAGLLDLGNTVDNGGIVPEELREIPIGILGAGPAGIIAARTLQQLGFSKITVFDPRGEYGGIWTQPNVTGLSKNNPAAMEAFGYRVERTPDSAKGSGGEVKEFLLGIVRGDGISGGRQLPDVTKAEVIHVDNDGALSHRVTYRQGDQQHSQEFAIVINAIGAGKPLPVSRPSHMTTDPESAKHAGTRWQKEFKPGELDKAQGKTLTFIGLGNSTAEMLLQVRAYNQQFKHLPFEERQAKEVNVRVLTHYPFDRIVPDRFGRIGAFRDLRHPNLTQLAGDLPSIRQVFEEARDSGQIVPGVHEWHIIEKEEDDPSDGSKKNKTKYIQVHWILPGDEDNPDGAVEEFPFDEKHFFTLIGYGHSPERLNALGVTVVDPDAREVRHDWDGEVQIEPEAEGDTGIPIPGYFTLGAVRGGQNDEVIPGILFDMPDTALSIIFRAAEWQRREGIPRRPTLRAPAPLTTTADDEVEEREPAMMRPRVLVEAGGSSRR